MHLDKITQKNGWQEIILETKTKAFYSQPSIQIKKKTIDPIDALMITTEDTCSAFNINQHVLLSSIEIKRTYDMIWCHRIQ